MNNGTKILITVLPLFLFYNSGVQIQQVASTQGPIIEAESIIVECIDENLNENYVYIYKNKNEGKCEVLPHYYIEGLSWVYSIFPNATQQQKHQLIEDYETLTQTASNYTMMGIYLNFPQNVEIAGPNDQLICVTYKASNSLPYIICNLLDARFQSILTGVNSYLMELGEYAIKARQSLNLEMLLTAASLVCTDNVEQCLERGQETESMLQTQN